MASVNITILAYPPIYFLLRVHTILKLPHHVTVNTEYLYTLNRIHTYILYNNVKNKDVHPGDINRHVSVYSDVPYYAKCSACLSYTG